MMENDRSPIVTYKQSKAQFFSVFSENRPLSNNIKKSKKNAKCVSQEQLKKKYKMAKYSQHFCL